MEGVPNIVSTLGFEIERGQKGSERKNLTVPEFKKLKEEEREIKKELQIKKDELIAYTKENQIDKEIDITPIKEMEDVVIETDEKSEAYKAGYKNICEIGKERIRRAGDKVKADNADKDGIENLDIGFRVLKLDDTNMNDVYYAAADYTQEMLRNMESNIKPDRNDMDLLYGCLLDWGLPLSMPHTSEKIDGFTVHTYNDGDLVACFDKKISEKAIREIAKKKPLRVVFRDNGFASSPEKINVFEIFKLIAPNTKVKVI